ncbi:hypothetical protein Gotri_005841 [Gossypium trilobum]|uniref:Aminotransferase-like plant mobile domain-containing protein n=1 Tax=Gossypium trilobum TaxID=34281 RepID=A0A7J9EXY1_9ROSI|nr:hypothetical protein [Gossypium trilobum]
MAWLRRNFGELDEDLTKVKREQHVHAYILMAIGGILMSDKSQNLVHLRWLLKLVNFREAHELNWGSTVLATLYWEMCWATQPRKIKIGGFMLLLQSLARYRLPFLHPEANYCYTFPLVTRWNHRPSYARVPKEMRDIQLLLDQQSEAEFVWTPYKDPTIRECISSEFLVNPNIWHMNLSLVVYVNVEMHESNRVMRQLRLRQSIPVAPQDLDDPYPIDLRGRPDEIWIRFHGEYINMWNNRYEFLPPQEAIVALE